MTSIAWINTMFGGPVYNQYSATGLTTLPATTTAVGDLLLLSADLTSGTNMISGISGGNVSSWTKVQYVYDGTAELELWYGTINATGPTTITVTWLTANSTFSELVAQEFPGGTTSSVWSVVTSQSQSDPSSTTMTTPSIAPTANGQLGWFCMFPTNFGYIGSTAGFTYEITDYQQVIAYNYSTISGTNYSPTASQSPAGVACGIGAFFTHT